MTGETVYTSLVSKLLFPLHEQLKGHTSLAIRKSLEESQWWPVEKMRLEQARLLQRFLLDISRSVPFYTSYFKEHELDATKLEGFELLKSLDLTDKAMMRARSSLLKARDASDLSAFATGGSTGEPLTFYLDKERVSHDVAGKWRAYRWWDVDFGDKELVFWGSPIELQASDRVRSLRDRAFRTRLLPAFAMSEDNLVEYLRLINRSKPTMLFGYPSAIYLLADAARRNSISITGAALRVIFVTGETLYTHQRACIEEVFGAPVANGYGGRDAGFIAHECPKGKMHICSDQVILEVVDRLGNVLPDGEQGELVVTHLGSRAFPFVRYRTGDVGSISTEMCRCGRGLQVLEELSGRSTDFVVASNGNVMHGLALIYVLREIQSISRFKIIQHGASLTECLVVPTAEFGQNDREKIVSGLRQRLGKDVSILVTPVEEIEPEASGKYRYVVSKVAQNTT